MGATSSAELQIQPVSYWAAAPEREGHKHSRGSKACMACRFAFYGYGEKPTLYSSTTPLQASASTLTILMSSYCFCSWSRMGSTRRQGPHQWAVKSTSTGCELLACEQRAVIFLTLAYLRQVRPREDDLCGQDSSVLYNKSVPTCTTWLSKSLSPTFVRACACSRLCR